MKGKKKKGRRGLSHSVVVPDAVDFVCPFCKARCSTSLELGAVFHEMPMCEKFEQLDPAEFLKAVNDKRAN